MRACLSMVACFALLFVAIRTSTGDPGDWKSLSHEQFIEQAASALRDKTVQRAAVDAEAVRRLIANDTATSATYAVLDQLTAWGRGLPDSEKPGIAQRIRARPAKPASLEFRELQSRYNALRRSGESRDDLAGDLAAWIESRELADVAVADLEWLCFKLAQGDRRCDRIKIVYSGFLRPKAQGKYEFSPSRIFTDRDWGAGRIRSLMRVTLDDVEIINTQKYGWHSPSRPMLLDTDRDLPITVTFIHDRERSQIGQSCPAVAMLYWKGPGIDPQLVPSDVLVPASKEGQGLTAEFTLTDIDRDTLAETLVDQATHVVPQIDAAWWQSHNAGVRGRRPQVDRILSHLVERYGDAAYLATLRPTLNERGKRDIEPWRQASELMTSAQRKQFLQSLLKNPQFIASLQLSHLRRLHHFLFPGNDEQALDVLRPWLHANGGRVMPPFRSEARLVDSQWQTLVDDIWMLPGAMDYFREQMVVRPDGSCCLMAAYIAAYGSGTAEEREAFVKWVGDRMSNPDLTADQSAVWMLARAAAEGLRNNKRRHNYIHQLDGWEWLERAMDTAESEEVKVMVARHQAARLLDCGDKHRLAKSMRVFQSQLRSPAAQAELGKWRAALEKLGAQIDVSGSQSPEDIVLYLKVLRDRLAAAEERGDDTSSARLRRLIAKVEAM